MSDYISNLFMFPNNEISVFSNDFIQIFDINNRTVELPTYSINTFDTNVLNDIKSVELPTYSINTFDTSVLNDIKTVELSHYSIDNFNIIPTNTNDIVSLYK